MTNKIIAIIPARSGSKTIIGKNIRLMNGLPLIAYSILQAIESKRIERVIVSTDSDEYRKIALKYGAEVPFLRPSNISDDYSLDIDVFKHTLKWLKDNEGYIPDIIVHLRPTHPIRNINDIDNMINILEKDESLDSVRSVTLSKQTPFKMWQFESDNSNIIKPIITSHINEAYNQPRQLLPKIYMQNACIDVVRSSVIINNNSMNGVNIAGYKTKEDFDIDTETEFLNAEKSMMLKKTLDNSCKLKICCDIDGIIATKTLENNYELSKPLQNNIKIINKLYEKGHYIVLFTARGYKTGIDWSNTTKQQIEKWNVWYHELHFGKPDADVYIDDKFQDLEELMKLL